MSSTDTYPTEEAKNRFLACTGSAPSKKIKCLPTVYPNGHKIEGICYKFHPIIISSPDETILKSITVKVRPCKNTFTSPDFTKEKSQNEDELTKYIVETIYSCDTHVFEKIGMEYSFLDPQEVQDTFKALRARSGSNTYFWGMISAFDLCEIEIDNDIFHVYPTDLYRQRHTTSTDTKRILVQMIEPKDNRFFNNELHIIVSPKK